MVGMSYPPPSCTNSIITHFTTPLIGFQDRYYKRLLVYVHNLLEGNTFSPNSKLITVAMVGEGVSTVITMWVLTSITFAFVLLRLYTRIRVTRSYGADDNVYILSFALFLLSTIFTTISAHYGFGQNIADIHDPDDLVRAIVWELIGQTASVLGTAFAKWSLGIFLLRLVTKLWLKIVIWTAMLILLGASIAVSFVGWLQCTPFDYLWDRRIHGICYINAVPASTVLNSLTVVVDFLFAALP
ncbi:hypothetical protein F4777DRAFT_559673 [Nemania sp. FL0916]|nr:hypothetical protein F4777DRAFT_559673 [Nemania sp. FL0916]